MAILELTSDDSEPEHVTDRRTILEPFIRQVVHALGGYEPDVGYRMGDEVNGCLKDLKKLWRKDDTDDDRTVARIFWEARVLPNDLVPILLATAGKGLVEDKRAVACADLMTAMTWPIDMAEELKELDDELDKGTDYTQLIQSHLHYKAALLKPGVMEALFGIMLAPLSKPPKERQERDGQVINVVLHLIRNLAFIKDLPFNTHLSSDQAEFSSLQTKLVRALSETHILKLLLTIAANADNDPLLNGWNTLVLETLYLLFRGVKPSSLAMDQAKQPTQALHRLLAAEERTRREHSRKATSRHSRFGTTIAVQLNPNKKPSRESDVGEGSNPESDPVTSRAFVLHRQQAINREAGSILDITKRHAVKKGTKLDELTREDNLSVEARNVLQGFAIEFVQACFNSFLAALLKDIRSERAKITEKDNLRLLFVTKWFLEFFLSVRGKEKTKVEQNQIWGFGLVAEVTERVWIVWVLKRMREAVEEKPKQWTELQTGVECLLQLLLLIEAMSSGDISDPTLKDAADILQRQIIYNGEVLDIAFESLRSYKPGTQSLAYLESSVHLAYALMRMLERWGKSKKDGDMYVRKKKVNKRKGTKGVNEGEDIPDVEEEVEEQAEVIHETMFTFEAFEMKFAHADITHTLLTYLARYKEFTSSESMRRVVSLLHRQAVRAKAEGLFFKVSTLDLFKTVLADQKSFPKEQPYKDLVNLITFILRQFFKALADEPFLAIEVFYPKSRGHWKQFSSWEPETQGKRERKAVEDTRFPQEVEVKKGYSWSDQLGIAIAALVEAGEGELVDWTTDILHVVIKQRERIIEETDLKDDEEPSDNDLETATARRLKKPSDEAMAKIQDYLIPYLNDEHADAATKNSRLKLLFRLAKFFVLEEHADEPEWYVPASIAPSDLSSTLTVIKQFLETPFDLEGKKASQLLSKKRRRRRRVRSPSPSSNDDVVVIDEDEPKRKKERKKKEAMQYKSAQFIEDSDEEYGGMDAFLEKEKAMRERIEAAAREGGRSIGTMKPTGTKKRRRKGKEELSTNKKQKGESDTAQDHGPSLHDSNIVNVTDNDSDVSAVSDSPPVPRPRPRAIAKRSRIPPESQSPRQKKDDAKGDHTRSPSVNADEINVPAPVKRNRARLVISDDED